MTKFPSVRTLLLANVAVVAWLGCWKINSRLLQVAPSARDPTLEAELEWNDTIIHNNATFHAANHGDDLPGVSANGSAALEPSPGSDPLLPARRTEVSTKVNETSEATPPSSSKEAGPAKMDQMSVAVEVPAEGNETPQMTPLESDNDAQETEAAKMDHKPEAMGTPAKASDTPKVMAQDSSKETEQAKTEVSTKGNETADTVPLDAKEVEPARMDQTLGSEDAKEAEIARVEHVSVAMGTSSAASEETPPLDVQPATVDQIQTNRTAENNITANLPAWMQKYAKWHQEKRAQLNETNWKTLSNRFLVMAARRGEQSGGLTDRLKPLPYFLKVAARSNRILLIYWTKPFPLEHYLLPPEGGLDWRVPKYMVEAVEASPQRKREQEIRRRANATGWGMHVMVTTMQAADYGEKWYDSMPMEGDGSKADRIAMFRHMWQWAFTPAPPLAQRIQQNFDQMGIVPGEYASAHVRAVYAIKDRPEIQIAFMAKHALDCISMLRPGGPFFVASDTASAVKAAVEYGRSKNVTVVASTYINGTHQKEPLHLDIFNTSDHSLVPEDFYDAFVDLYLLGNTRCVTHGKGSFGHWGYLLGFDSTCQIKHKRGHPRCKWKDPPLNHETNTTETMQAETKPRPTSPRPLFRPSMS